MVDPNTRQGKRTPVTLKIKFKSETLEQFIERYAVDVSQGGIFIRTKEPLAVGTQMKFEFQLRDASPLIAGEGTVVWTRENDPSRPAIAPGMGVRFDRLADGSQSILERILAEKAKQAPQRPLKETTKPPLFTDTPTRVAPAPMQEALLGNADNNRRKRADSADQSDEKTPLPKPMPFHSDADDFSEEAFEEATKVRALDELVAQTALADGGKATPDELAARRNLFRPEDNVSGTLPAEAQGQTKTPSNLGDRDSAPGLPSPPEQPARPSPKMLDTTPSPRESSPSQPPLNQQKTRLGLEPVMAKTSAVSKDALTMPSGIHVVPQGPTGGSLNAAATSSQNLPQAKRPSSAPIIIGIIVGVAAIGAAVWFFLLREPTVESLAPLRNPIVNNGTDGSAGSATVGSATMETPIPTDGSNAKPVTNGSNGSATAMTNGSAGSASEKPVPAAAMVDTVIGSTIDKTMIEVEGTELKGPAPLTAKLEKDKSYRIKLSAFGYVPAEFDVKGGDAKINHKLDAKKFIVTINSTPPGAAISVDGVVGKSPFELKAPPKKAVRVRVVRAGFKPAEVSIDLDKWTDGDTMTFTQDVRLAVAPINVPVPVPPTAGSGSGSGSAAEPAGSGTTPPPPPNPGSGSEPTPDFANP